jgi:hypothetical protein
MIDANASSVAGRFNANPPASREEIARVQSNVAFALPKSYVEFLLAANGGEGFIGTSYVILWKIEEIASKNISYNVAEFAPGILLFGSNGGGEALGFDACSNGDPIISIPFVTMEKKDALAVAPDFEAFLAMLSA